MNVVSCTSIHSFRLFWLLVFVAFLLNFTVCGNYFSMRNSIFSGNGTNVTFFFSTGKKTREIAHTSLQQPLFGRG
jgi:hypothetical protein